MVPWTEIIFLKAKEEILFSIIWSRKPYNSTSRISFAFGCSPMTWIKDWKRAFRFLLSAKVPKWAKIILEEAFLNSFGWHCFSFWSSGVDEMSLPSVSLRSEHCSGHGSFGHEHSGIRVLQNKFLNHSIEQLWSAFWFPFRRVEE